MKKKSVKKSVKKTKGPKSQTAGIIPHIFDHYKALPVFYRFDHMPIEKLTDKISRQYIYANQSMIVKLMLKKGAEVPLHHHVNEQITWIVKGSVKIFSQGKEFIVKAGEVIIFPPHVPHEFFALENTIDIDFFAPVREDWITQSATYFQKKSK